LRGKREEWGVRTALKVLGAGGGWVGGILESFDIFGT